ncbi:MAG TPA: hypothetical protein VH079_02170 [Terriglobales bacterium]|jgi:hypothetical protein|nr:hypothetical protein [Terriglobales bacterium]
MKKDLKLQLKDFYIALEASGKSNFVNALRSRDCSLEEKLTLADAELHGSLEDRIAAAKKLNTTTARESIELRENTSLSSTSRRTVTISEQEKMNDAVAAYRVLGLSESEARCAAGEDPYLIECASHGFGADKVEAYARLRWAHSSESAAKLIRMGITD